MLPKNFLNDLNKIKGVELWNDLNNIMLLENDKLKGYEFNEMTSYLESLNVSMLDDKVLKKQMIL